LIEKICADKNISVKVEEEDAAELAKNAEIKAAQKELLTYNYFYIDDEDDTTDDSRVNVWSVNDHMFEHIFAIVGSANKEERLMIIVTLDLTKPGEEVVASLEKWLMKSASYVQDYYKNLGENDASSKIRNNTVNYLKHARVTRGRGANLTEPMEEFQSQPASPEDELNNLEAELDNGADESKNSIPEYEESEDVDKYPFIFQFFGLPILVVGCKADLMPTHDAAAIRDARDTQAQIRAICLDVGAALIYTSIVPEYEENMKVLKKYIEHRLYPENLLIQDQQGELSMEDSVEKTFIPSGFDTLALINMSSGLDLIPHKFRSDFDPAIIENYKVTADLESTANEDPVTVMEIESEQEWLTSLYGFITQVSGGSIVAEVPTSNELPANSRRSNIAIDSVSSSAASGGGRRVTIAGKGPADSTSQSSSSSTSPLPSKSSAALTALFGSTDLDQREEGSLSARRRPSVRGTTPNSNTSSEGKQDVGDFFKNLLQGSVKK